MTSPPFFFNCKHCGQDKILGDYPEWWICPRCLFKNTFHWVLFFKWISCRPINNKELEEIGRPILEDDISRKYTYEERLKKKTKRGVQHDGGDFSKEKEHQINNNITKQKPISNLSMILVVTLAVYSVGYGAFCYAFAGIIGVKLGASMMLVGGFCFVMLLQELQELLSTKQK